MKENTKRDQTPVTLRDVQASAGEMVTEHSTTVARVLHQSHLYGRVTKRKSPLKKTRITFGTRV